MISKKIDPSAADAERQKAGADPQRARSGFYSLPNKPEGLERVLMTHFQTV